MSRQDAFTSEIGDVIAEQIAMQNSPQAAHLAHAFKKEIRRQRDAGVENRGALSLDATYEEGAFGVRVAFDEDSTMTVMYYRHTDDATVAAIYQGLAEADDELCRLAALMLSEGWVKGYRE